MTKGNETALLQKGGNMNLSPPFEGGFRGISVFPNILLDLTI
jgi:hypothetical protein